MTPQELAALHHLCFQSAPRPWSANEFAGILETRGAFLVTRPNGFLLGRAIAGEAELLTLAVDPRHRRLGTGAILSTEFAARARNQGAETAFLEVAADNIAARSLYQRMGWTESGRRRDYYGAGRDALTLRLEL
ncbi:GNAT family N-acetyltransferase [Paracoccus sp. Z330]|uniref:GNAT family N-acetyltransferase n=1 Tax=Paracoccus onchidii TaxID=3017813 RepID=A0ABT4ZCI4_9RHOB|nr:GNAT family N-acetyltransferase [Paracoccus onchidii]MDB6176852.1 GNAT family N-acetyltransferase [Paracoccus onchidii]